MGKKSVTVMIFEDFNKKLREDGLFKGIDKKLIESIKQKSNQETLKKILMGEEDETSES